MASISSAPALGASALALLLAACGPPTPRAAGTSPEPVTVPARPLAEVFVLEAAGGQPDDTTLHLIAGDHRVIVLRRSAPDFGLFARIEAGSDSSGSGLTIRPRPGEYALELTVQGALAKQGSILFSYGSHFVAPAGARERYGSDIHFERALAIGRLDAKGEVIFLPTSRPGSDMLSAPLDGPGRYLVAAPR